MDDIDLVLHGERLDRERRKLTYPALISELPPGVMVADRDGAPLLVLEQRLLRWDPCGYSQGISRPAVAVYEMLTPTSVVLAILRGYPVLLHPSAFAPGQ